MGSTLTRVVRQLPVRSPLEFSLLNFKIICTCYIYYFLPVFIVVNTGGCNME